jgi:RNA polymerase sigma factor (sigma-70 family)
VNLDWTRRIEQWADAWHDDLVRFLARRTTTVADAQDLAQEVYLRLLRVDRSELVRQPRSYVFRMAANALNEWRLRARQRHMHDGVLEDLSSDADPVDDAVVERRQAHLLTELSRLALPVRIALVMHARDGLGHKEIAKQMEVTPRMVKRYLQTGYAQLRARVPRDL